MEAVDSSASRTDSGGRGTNAVAASARPVRLLQVLGYAGTRGERAGVTGVERVALALLEGLDSRRFEHYVAYPETGELSGAYRSRARAVLALEPRRRYDAAYIEALVDCVRAHSDPRQPVGLRIRPEPASAITLPACMMTWPRRMVATGAPLDERPSAGIQPQR